MKIFKIAVPRDIPNYFLSGLDSTLLFLNVLISQYIMYTAKQASRRNLFLYFFYSTFSQICCVTYFYIYFFNYFKLQRRIGCYKSISLRFYYNLWSLWQKLLSLKRLRRCKLFGLKFREQTHQEVANKLGIDTTQKECVSSRFEMFSPQILKFVVISNKFNEKWVESYSKIESGNHFRLYLKDFESGRVIK